MSMDMHRAFKGLGSADYRAMLVLASRDCAAIPKASSSTGITALGVDSADLTRRLKPLLERVQDDDALKVELLTELARRAYGEAA
jgi:hypothetical protein